jgi:subtilisin family serine protease
MRYLLLLYNIIALICSSAAQSSMAPGAYIVEMIPTVNDASPPFSAHNTHVQAFHLAATEIKYTIRYNFTNLDIFFGVSLQVENTTKSDEEIRKYFSTKPGVISVTPVWVVDIPTPADGEESPTVSDLEPFWNPFKPKPTSTSTPMQLMGPFKGGNLSSSLRMGGVDRLHALGIKGKGIRIGIIDTGVDYQHPALGGKFGPGNKIAGGHAYVDNHGNPIDKNDPLTKCPQGGHGTHVAGQTFVT